MPASSISNGHTGTLLPASQDNIKPYLDIIGATINMHTPRPLTQQTIGKQLHVVEFWMPGPCNLRCSHCYVADSPTRKPKTMTADDYARLTKQMVKLGLHDVVIPGMEPLLREETWVVADAARAAGARSVGLTTNGILLKQSAQRLADAALTVINVSLDGPREVHDHVRGSGVFDAMSQGVSELLHKTDATRLISNCTASRINIRHLPEVARIANDMGFTFASYHPFEPAAGIDNSILLSAQEAVDGYEAIRSTFEAGQCGSVVLEVEASTFDVILEMHRRGWFADMELVSDETGFLFYRLHHKDRLLLVNLMGYPHHFIRTLRITDDGGLSSCRAMAHSAWVGLGGDMRTHTLEGMLASEPTMLALDYIWQEFMDACSRMPRDIVEGFLHDIQAAQVECVKQPLPASTADVTHAS